MTRQDFSSTIPTDKKRAILAAYIAGDPPPAQEAALSLPFPDVLVKLAARLEPDLREPFRRALAIALAHYRPAEISCGMVERVGRELLRQFK